MAHISETDSISSTQSTIDLQGGAKYLEGLKETKMAIRLVAKNLCAQYACFLAMDPQTWEDTA